MSAPANVGPWGDGATSASIPVGPWPLGVCNRFVDTELPDGGLLEAVDVNITREGEIETRAGALPAFGDLSCPFQYGRRQYGVRGQQIGWLDGDTFVPLATIEGTRVTWSVLDGKPMFTFMQGVGVVDGDTVRMIDSSGYPEEITSDAGTISNPGGDYARQWRGRLLLARGRTLYYSPPFRYGLIRPRADYIRFASHIAFIEAVDGGVYVGLVGRGVVFLAGEAPERWVQKPASDAIPQAGASAVMGTSQMEEKFRTADEVAVWFTEAGFAIGMPNGQVVLPQADRLSGLPLGIGSLAVQGDRLIVLSQ